MLLVCLLSHINSLVNPYFVSKPLILALGSKTFQEMPQKNENGKKFHQSPSLSNFQAFYHVSQVTVHWWVVDYQAKSLYYLVYMHFVLCHAKF